MEVLFISEMHRILPTYQSKSRLRMLKTELGDFTQIFSANCLDSVVNAVPGSKGGKTASSCQGQDLLPNHFLMVRTEQIRLRCFPCPGLTGPRVNLSPGSPTREIISCKEETPSASKSLTLFFKKVSFSKFRRFHSMLNS